MSLLKVGARGVRQPALGYMRQGLRQVCAKDEPRLSMSLSVLISVSCSLSLSLSLSVSLSFFRLHSVLTSWICARYAPAKIKVFLSLSVAVCLSVSLSWCLSVSRSRCHLVSRWLPVSLSLSLSLSGFLSVLTFLICAGYAPVRMKVCLVV